MKNSTNGWQRYSLEELSETINYGLTASAVHREDGPRFLRITDIQDNTVKWASVPSCNASRNELVQCQLQAGDIVFARTGATTGKSFLIRNCPNEAVFASYLIRVRPGNRINPIYLSHYFNTPEYWAQIQKEAQGAGQPGVNSTKLKTLSIPLPPLPEQRRIADILDKADGIRRKRQEANQLASSIATSLCEDRFGDPVNNRKGWGVVAMESLYAIAPNYGTMIVPSESRKRWLDLRVANIQNGVLDLSDKKYVDLPEDAIYRHEVRKGDLLLARAIGSIDHLGKCFIADPGEDQWAFDSHLMRIRFDTTKVEPRYVHAFLISPGGRHEFLRNSRRSAVQFNINTKEMARIQITLPPLDVQREFVRDLDRLSSITRCQIESDAKISNLFNSLVQRAFRGEL